MIITVTMNPAADKTAETDSIKVGGLNRLRNVVIDAGGKGINVSKTIAALGGLSIATGFIGGSAGADIEHSLQCLGITTDFVEIRRPTRTNLKVLSCDSGVTEFNEPGSAVTPDEMKSLEEKLLDYADAESGATFIFSGSLPDGVNPDVYKRLIEAVRKKGSFAFLDSDGEAFRQALTANPDFIKPNISELQQYFGENTIIHTINEQTRLCNMLIEGGVGSIALSMGERGALFVSREEAFYAPAICVKAKSTVGAGDAMVGALAYAFEKGMDFRGAAKLAVAASAGAVMTDGTRPPGIDTVTDLLERVELTP
ncbi:MAG: 1-phosphofructokinase family hexose kinase [Oscillospiraceae bacterium]|nr:1-phosphofructokinase family hexose kinase [Oscillospiraceae bacterium]